MIVEADGLRWETTLPLNVGGTDALRKRNYPTKQAVLGPRSTQQVSPPEPLRGKRFLIVEDEPLIALEIMAGLESVGVDVEGPVGSAEDALRAIDDLVHLMASSLTAICAASVRTRSRRH